MNQRTGPVGGSAAALRCGKGAQQPEVGLSLTITADDWPSLYRALGMAHKRSHTMTGEKGRSAGRGYKMDYRWTTHTEGSTT